MQSDKAKGKARPTAVKRRPTKATGEGRLSPSGLAARKRAWAQAAIATEGIDFLAALLETSDVVAAYRQTSKARAVMGWTEARRGANRLMLALNQSHPGVVEDVIRQANLLARQKTQLELNAALDTEADEQRADAVLTNLRRFAAAGEEPEAPDRDPRPVAAGAVSLTGRIQALLRE